MPSPFPGMDPYLESPDLWPDVHLELIRDIRAALNPHVLPKYNVRNRQTQRDYRFESASGRDRSLAQRRSAHLAVSDAH